MPVVAAGAPYPVVPRVTVMPRSICDTTVLGILGVQYSIYLYYCDSDDEDARIRAARRRPCGARQRPLAPPADTDARR